MNNETEKTGISYNTATGIELAAQAYVKKNGAGYNGQKVGSIRKGDYTNGAVHEALRAIPLLEALKVAQAAMEWMWEHMDLTEGNKHLQSDAFNVPANAIEMAKDALGNYLNP